MSKGSNRRPEDSKQFDQNYSLIFGNKQPERGSFVWCEERKKMIPKDEFYSQYSPNVAYVIADIQPYQSQATGEMITSRSQHREHLKRHGLIEIGNEIDYHMKKQPPKDDREARRRVIAEVLNSKGY